MANSVLYYGDNLDVIVSVQRTRILPPLLELDSDCPQLSRSER
jgi:hypothetical protein